LRLATPTNYHGDKLKAWKIARSHQDDLFKGPTTKAVPVPHDELALKEGEELSLK